MRLAHRVLLLSALILASACGTKLPGDLSGKQCDDKSGCTDGWYCNPKKNVCIPNGTSFNTAPTVKLADSELVATGPTTPVTLDASSAADADGDQLTFVWKEGDTQLSTKAVDTVQLAKGTHAISLEVSDGYDKATASTTITVKNAIPVAVAGDDLTVTGHPTAKVALDGSKSTDADGDSLSFRWLEGTTVLATSAKTEVELDAGPHALELEVSDSEVTSKATVHVNVVAGPRLEGSLAAPTAVSIGQVFEVTLSVKNAGEAGAAAVTAGELQWAGGAQAELISGPTPAQADIAGGAQAGFSWQVRVLTNGSLHFTVGAHGVDQNDGTTPITLEPVSSQDLTATQGAALVASLFTDASPVDLGKEFGVVLRVTNTGQGMAKKVAPATLGQSGAGAATLKSGPTPQNVDVAGGATVEYHWTYVASRGGSVVFSGAANGTDENSGAIASSPTANAAELVIQAPANVSTTTVASRTSVDLNQTFTVTLTVKNERPGAITDIAPTLQADCTQCVAVLDGPKPAQLAQLPAGGSQDFLWTLKGAQRGSVRLSGGAAFSDGATRAFATGSRTEAVAVQAPTQLAITAISAPASVTQGQDNVPVTVTVENSGDAKGTIEAIDLALAFAQGADASGQFVVTAAQPFPVPIDGAATATVGFKVKVKSTAPAGAVVVGASGRGTDVNTAAALQIGPNGQSASMQVQAPPHLTIASLTSSASKVSQGQQATVTLALHNDGGAQARLGATQLSFTLAGQSRATDYTVTASPDNPTTIGAGQTASLSFAVAVAPTAQPGALSVNATVAATDANSGAAASAAPAANPLSWTVQTPARPAVQSLSPASAKVSQGQASAALDVTIANQGDADLAVRNAHLTFLRGSADASADFTVQPAADNAATVAGHSTATLHFQLAVAQSAAEGAVTVSATFNGVDANSGASTAAAAPSTPATWTVQRPAHLLVTQVTAPATLAQGDTVLVTAHVENAGQAAASLDGTGLAFASGATGRNVEYSVQPDPANATSVAGGASADVQFHVTALSTATTGVQVDVTPVISASDMNSTAIATVDVSASAHWTVSTSAHLAISTVRSGATLVAQQNVSQGQSAIPVTVRLNNTGVGDAVIDTIALTFRTQTGVDRAASFTAPAASGNPTSVPGGGSADFRFTVAVAQSAAAETLVVGARLTAHQASGNETINPTGPESAASWTVQTPAKLRVVSVASSAQKVSQGQAGVPLQVVVANDGQAGAAIDYVAASFRAGSADATSQYTLHAQSGNATTIAGGAQATFAYTADVSANAVTGAITVDARTGGSDQNSASSISASGAQTPGSLLVQTPAKLVLDAVTSSAAKASRGQTGITVSVTAHNAGEAALSLSAAALKFTQAGGDRSGDYTATRTDSTSRLEGGASATLTFSVQVKASASTGTTTVDATGAGSDLNSSAQLSAAGATSTASLVVQTPAALSAALAVTPDIVQADDPNNRTITVTMTVTNNGQADAAAVAPGPLTLGGSGSATLSGGPTPSGQQTIAGGQNKTFTWTYRATGTCSVNFTGAPSGQDANTGATITAASAKSSDVLVKKVPLANAGSDFSVFLDDRVSLDARATQPGDCDAASTLTYQWTPSSTNTYPVTLSSTTSTTPTFDARGAGTIAFDLVVTAQNPTRSSTATVMVTVRQFEAANMTGVSSSGQSMRAVAFDGAGRLAAATDDYAWMSDGSSWRKLGTLASASASVVLADQSDRFWFGYSNSNKVERATYDWSAGAATIEQKLLQDGDPNSPSAVRAIALAPSSNDVWFATDIDLFSVPGGNLSSSLTRRNPAGSCTLGSTSCRSYYAVGFDRLGNVYAGSNAALFSSSTGFSQTPTPDRIASGGTADNIRTIAMGANNELWVGTTPPTLGTANGLAEIADVTAAAHPWSASSWTKYSTSSTPAISGNDIRALLTDANGDVWIATNGGITRYIRARATFKNYVPGSDGLPSGFNPRALAVDEKGGRRSLAIATAAGLVQLKR